MKLLTDQEVDRACAAEYIVAYDGPRTPDTLQCPVSVALDMPDNVAPDADEIIAHLVDIGRLPEYYPRVGNQVMALLDLIDGDGPTLDRAMLRAELEALEV